MDADGLLQGLNPDQHDAVVCAAAPLCIIAGAGSGKTRVLTRRVAHRVAVGDAEPHRVLALTFTRKAAGELTARLAGLGLRDTIAAGTFHGIALAQLRARWIERGEREPQLLDRKYSAVARQLPRRASQRDVNPLDAIAEIEWAKARRIAPRDYAEEALQHNRRPPMPPHDMAAVYERYEEDKHRRGLVDFDDLLMLCERALASDPAFAATQRWRFRHLFVDEFQDVNPLQFALLRAWLGDRSDLCVVGDPRQAIYAWNGADAGYLNDFTRHFPGSEVRELRDNYRSTPQILAVANAVIGHREAGAPLRANRPSGEPPEIVQYTTDADEARGIARAVRDAHGPGRPWSDQAVLTRTNAQAALIADALGRAAIPHRVRGGAALLSRPEVKSALARMRSSSVPFAVALADLDAEVTGRFVDDDDPVTRGDDTGDGPRGATADLARAADPTLAATSDARRDAATSRIPRGSRPSPTSRGVQPSRRTPTTDRHAPETGPHDVRSAQARGTGTDERDGPPGGADQVGSGAQERRANLAALVQLGRDYLGLDSSASAAGFAAWLNAAARSDDAAGAGDAVEVATFHAAKGLEWPIVHVAGVEGGLVPIGHARTPDAEAEERRLFYVALTRAERVLRCSWATQRTFGSRVSNRQPSPYLSEVREVLGSLAAGRRPVDGLVEVRRERERLAAEDGEGRRRVTLPAPGATLSDDEQAVLDALKSWRATQARFAKVRASTVLTDEALEAVAINRPRDVAGLSALPGIDKMKARRFGETLLAVVAAHDR